jgi:hypothetical protein
VLLSTTTTSARSGYRSAVTAEDHLGYPESVSLLGAIGHALGRGVHSKAAGTLRNGNKARYPRSPRWHGDYKINHERRPYTQPAVRPAYRPYVGHVAYSQR